MSKTITESPVKVLLVDDEKNILQSLNRLLLDEDFEVLTANSGESGLEILEENPDIGLIVSDQRMPGLTGVDFLERAKEMSPDTLRILLTGHEDINASIKAINKGGAHRYITKPWKDGEFLQVIREAAQKYSLIKENKRLTEIVKKQNEELTKWNDQLQYKVQEQTLEIQEKNDGLQELNNNFKRNFKNTIIAFSGLLELRNKGSESHARNVGIVCVDVARAMKLSDEEIEIITVAALLHDIGKIGISDAMLQKNIEELDDDERNEYMLHSVRGQTAVDSIEDLRRAGILIRHHHEWYNGMGFPDRLQGVKNIPLGSRIIAIADFIDRTIRNLKGENGIERTLINVEENLGSRFDPKLYPYIEPTLKKVYKDLVPSSDVVERELYPKELHLEMVLSRDVRSGTGLLLLRKGAKLNRNSINALRRNHQLDPLRKGVFVWVKND
jgi:response regulator RpfG family c-di-GMP phosphodiesterase